MATKEIDMEAPSSKSSAASTVNEEGDAPAAKPSAPPSPPAAEEIPVSKQRLGAYKHFARTANRTLTTFTNEMSEILRQSIERLDSISMKVRGCVYDIERQRVAMPHALPGIGEVNETLPGVPASIPEDVWECGDDGKKSLISDIKEIAVKCKKTPSAERIPVEQFKLLSASDHKPTRLDIQILPVELPPPAAAPAPQVEQTLQLESLKQKISNRNTPRATDSAHTTTKKNPSHEPTSSSNMDEIEVIQRIKKQHKRIKRREANPIPDGGGEPKKVERKRRVPRKRDTNTTVTTNAKRPRHLKKGAASAASAAGDHTKEAASPSARSPRSRKSVKSIQSMRLGLTLPLPKDGASPSGVRMELKNTKLARKFASSNFHDAHPKDAGVGKVESYTGGRMVKLTSDSRQDWSVIMHTQKSPTRYELRQSAPFPTTNILDEITLKDLEPLKAEYPRRDNMHGCNQRIEDSLLYKLVNGTPESMECLINVSSSARRTESVQATGATATATQPVARKRFVSQVPPTFALPSSGVPPLQVTHLSTKVGNPAVTKSSIGGLRAKREDSRAGIYRAQEQRAAVKRPINVKESVVEQSKRIALKLSEMKTGKYTAPLQENHQIYKQGKKDAKRRLKQYLADPAKTHQKYMVMMVHSIVYDKSEHRSVADILAKYIYLDTEWKWEQEYTVGIMTTSTGTGPCPSPSAAITRRPYIESVVVTPTRERESARSPAFSGRSVQATTTPRGGESSWKNIIRSCYMQPTPANTHAQAQAQALAVHKSMDPSQVRSIISNMELQLKQVIDNPKIENKEVVIKGLQEQMEWILCTLEGQTFALKKRKDENATRKVRRGDRTILPRKERREPILKPMDSTVKGRLHQHQSEIQLQSSPSPLGGHLRKTPATMVIPSSSTSEITITPTSPITSVPNEMQTKLMTKWRTLEHPSGESLEIESLKDLSLPSAHDDSAFHFLEAKKVKSRPETRREGRLAFGSGSRKSISTLGSNSSQERYQSQYEGSLNRDGKRASTNTEKMLDQILAKIELDEEEHEVEDDQELEQEQELGSQEESRSSEGLTQTLNLFDEDINREARDRDKDRNRDRDNLYDSVPDAEDPQPPTQLTSEEISQYQESIKVLESQLGEETQRFVDEMDEVIKRIESASSMESKDDAARVEYASHVASSATSLASDVMHVVTVVESIQLGKPVEFDIGDQTIHMEVELDLPERDENHPIQQPIIGQMSPKDISKALTEDMRKHFAGEAGDTGAMKKIDRRRDYDLMEPKPKESPMIQDIRRSLLQIHMNAPKETKIQKLQAPLQNAKGDNTPIPTPGCNVKYNKMIWETTDKSTSTTTVSLTNLDDFGSGSGHGHEPSVQTRQSKSEINITQVTQMHDKTCETGSISLGRTVQLVESALSARVTRFFTESGLSTLSHSVESILSATLAATLANQERLYLNTTLPKSPASTESPAPSASSPAPHVEKQHFQMLLTFVYSFVFAILCLGLNWCPACIA